MEMEHQLFDKAKETRRRVVGKSAALLSSAFALVAGLAWNDAVKALIDAYLPAASGVYPKFLYAIILTVVVVFVTARLAKYAEKE